MHRNRTRIPCGFEITRALWAYQNGSGYEVFAGGTRLEAAKRAGLNEVPVVLHEGLTDEDIVRLAYEDNENDEYHQSILILDEWADCVKLYELWGDQKKVAKAIGISQSLVSERVQWNRLPDTIKLFIYQGIIQEAHLRQITKISINRYFASWLMPEQAQLEIIQEVAKRFLPVNKTKNLVDKWQNMIQSAQGAYLKLKERQESYEGKNHREKFAPNYTIITR